MLYFYCVLLQSLSQSLRFAVWTSCHVRQHFPVGKRPTLRQNRGICDQQLQHPQWMCLLVSFLSSARSCLWSFFLLPFNEVLFVNIRVHPSVCRSVFVLFWLNNPQFGSFCFIISRSSFCKANEPAFEDPLSLSWTVVPYSIFTFTEFRTLNIIATFWRKARAN